MFTGIFAPWFARAPVHRLSLLAGCVLLLTGCAPASALPANSIPTAVPATPTSLSSTASPTAVIMVTGTLDGVRTLPHRIQWEVKPVVPPGELLSRVEFLIDGNLAWIERQKPYVYGGDGNYLVTSFIKPGEHEFTSRVVTLHGATAVSTVKAVVVAEPVLPEGLADSSWTRNVTPSDMKKATSHEPPPAGQWGLTIDSVGWMVHDPEGGSLLFDVGYQSQGIVELRGAIEQPPSPNPLGGAFCEEPDPPILWAYSLDESGKTLTLHPVTTDPCGDRLAILQGAWKQAIP